MFWRFYLFEGEKKSVQLILRFLEKLQNFLKIALTIRTYHSLKIKKLVCHDYIHLQIKTHRVINQSVLLN